MFSPFFWLLQVNSERHMHTVHAQVQSFLRLPPMLIHNLKRRCFYQTSTNNDDDSLEMNRQYLLITMPSLKRKVFLIIDTYQVIKHAVTIGGGMHRFIACLSCFFQLPQAPYHFSDDLARPDRCPLIFAITQVGRLWLMGGMAGCLQGKAEKVAYIYMWCLMWKCNCVCICMQI